MLRNGSSESIMLFRLAQGKQLTGTTGLIFIVHKKKTGHAVNNSMSSIGAEAARGTHVADRQACESMPLAEHHDVLA
jgi:hypothetical protein